MKQTLQKISAVCKKIAAVCKIIFGYGIMLVLFAGGLLFFGYLAAVIIGGETATEICTFLSKTLTPYIVYTSTVLILFGLMTMYLAGEKALTPGKKTKQEEGER